MQFRRLGIQRERCGLVSVERFDDGFRGTPGQAKPCPMTPRRTILCCVLRNLGVPRLTEANAESISHRCVGAGRSERLFGLYLGHWPLLGALRFFLHCAHIMRRRSAPLHDNSRLESAGFTIRREEGHDFVQRNLTID